MNIIKELKSVDDVFLEESLELKADYIRCFKAQTLVMGDDSVLTFYSSDGKTWRSMGSAMIQKCA